jgi:hypothetical protein
MNTLELELPDIGTPDTRRILSVDAALTALLRACAAHFKALPRLVRIAYINRDHRSLDIGMWTLYLKQLQQAFFETPPELLPAAVKAAYVEYLIAQCCEVSHANNL